MEQLGIYKTFWKINNARKLYSRYNEVDIFISAVSSILEKDLEQFGEIVTTNTGEPLFGKPVLTIEVYDTVEEVFEVLRNIFCDAAESDSYTGYRFMQFELAYLFTPVITKKIPY